MHFSSKERMQEVVLRTVFKISEKEISQSDLLRTVTNLLNDAEKVYLFKNTEHNEIDEIKKYHLELLFKSNYFLSKRIAKALIKENNELLSFLLVQKTLRLHEYIFRKIFSKIRYLKTQYECHTKESVFYNHNNQPVVKQKQIGEIDLQHLKILKHDLLITIQQRQNIIVISRRYAINRAIQWLYIHKEIQMSFFKGMSIINQKLFIEGYFRLKEEEAVSVLQIQQNREQLLRAHSQQKVTQNKTLVKGFQLASIRPNIEKMNDYEMDIKCQTLQKIKQLGTKTGHKYVNTMLTDKECEASLNDFERQDSIKAPLADHLKLVKEQSALIAAESKEIAGIDAQIEQSLTTEELHQHLSGDEVSQLFEKAAIISANIIAREHSLGSQVDMDDLELTLNELLADPIKLSSNLKM